MVEIHAVGFTNEDNAVTKPGDSVMKVISCQL
jgi:hypothetical protein